MAVLNGLKKLLAKREKFAPPNQYVLTSKEKEGVIVLFSLLACVLLVAGVLLILH